MPRLLVSIGLGLICVAGLSAATLPAQTVFQVSGEVVVVPPHASIERTIAQKLGGVQLPYAGGGALEYDVEERMWIISFLAPQEADCTHIGWSFPAGDVVPALIEEDEFTWSVVGEMDVFVNEGVLYLSVWTDGVVHNLDFVYSEELADHTITFGSDGEQLMRLAGDCGVAPAGGDSCPGGSCSCTGKCSACCASGYYPRCNCSKSGYCTCIKEKPKPDNDDDDDDDDDDEIGPLEFLHYEMRITTGP